MGFKPIPTLVAIAIGLMIWFVIAVPQGVAPQAWHLLALFVATIAAIIGKAMPIGALSLLAIALVAITGVTSDKAATAIAVALSSFANPITSAMFITATAPNPLVVKLIADATGAQIQLSRAGWALAMLCRGLVALALMPWAIYLLHPPQIKSTPDAAALARRKLAEQGLVSRGEKIMLGVFVLLLLLLLLWAGVPAMLLGPAWAADPTTTAFYGAGLALGAPALPFALTMAAASNIMLTLTHYATGASPVIFGPGFTTLAERWRVGFVMSLVLLGLWLVVGAGSLVSWLGDWPPATAAPAGAQTG